LGLSRVEMGNRVVDVRVSAEVGYKVIFFVRGTSLGPVPMVTELFFGKIEIRISSGDFVILWSKIGDEVVLWMAGFLRLW